MKDNKITREYIQRFCTGMDKLMLLSYMEIYLILWLAERVDEDNRVITTKETRDAFVNFIVRVSSKNGEENLVVYSESSVKTAISNLKKHELLIVEPGRRGRCWVNPLYFFKDNFRKRNNIIREIEYQQEEFERNKLYESLEENL